MPLRAIVACAFLYKYKYDQVLLQVSETVLILTWYYGFQSVKVLVVLVN